MGKFMQEDLFFKVIPPDTNSDKAVFPSFVPPGRAKSIGSYSGKAYVWYFAAILSADLVDNLKRPVGSRESKQINLLQRLKNGQVWIYIAR
jgi:hypothetical protein